VHWAVYPVQTVTIASEDLVFEQNLFYDGYDISFQRDQSSDCCCWFGCDACSNPDPDYYCATSPLGIPCVSYWGEPQFDTGCLAGRNIRACGSYRGVQTLGPVYTQALTSYSHTVSAVYTIADYIQDFTLGIGFDQVVFNTGQPLTLTLLALPELPATALTLGDPSLLLFYGNSYIVDGVNDINGVDPTKPGFFKMVGGVLDWNDPSLRETVSVSIQECKDHGVTFIDDAIAKYATIMIEQNTVNNNLGGFYDVITSQPFHLQTTQLGAMQVTLSGTFDQVEFEQSQATVKAEAAGSFSICQRVPHPAWVTWTANSSGIVAIVLNETVIGSFYVSTTDGNTTFPYPLNVTDTICLHSSIISCVFVDFSCSNEVAPVVTTDGSLTSGGKTSLNWWIYLIIALAVIGCCVCCVFVVYCCAKQGSQSSTINLVIPQQQQKLLSSY